MGAFIIEYIGRGKDHKIEMKHTDTSIYRSRYQKPQPGDVVDFGEDYKNNPYPYNSARYGRVDNHNSVFCETENDYHVCLGGASVFWGDGYVSISGGPFGVINLKNLEPTWSLHVAHFWNWGNNSPGGGMGVDYYIARPVFMWRQEASDDNN